MKQTLILVLVVSLVGGSSIGVGFSVAENYLDISNNENIFSNNLKEKNI